MTHQAQREWLITQLLREKPEYARYQIPKGDRDQKNLLRALMNVRMPEPVSEEYLAMNTPPL